MIDLPMLSAAQMRRIETYFPLSHGVPRVANAPDPSPDPAVAGPPSPARGEGFSPSPARSLICA
jgi:hypothetical protein